MSMLEIAANKIITFNIRTPDTSAAEELDNAYKAIHYFILNWTIKYRFI